MQLDKLTLGELDFIEKTSGLGLSEMGEKDNPKGALLMALAVITKRRTGFPTYGLVEAAQLNIADGQKLINEGPFGNPKPVATDPAEAKAEVAAGEDVGENATANSPSSSSDWASDLPTTLS